MDVSVVIVSYNASSYLKECINSIFEKTENTSLEIIVVDNNSPDNSLVVATQVKSEKLKVKIIANKDNRGFGAGINIGLKRATGKYILILNPDILFLEDSISKMVAYMGQHLDVGLAGCQFIDGEENLLPNGGYFPTLIRLFFWTFFLDDLPLISNLIKSYHPKSTSIQYQVSSVLDWVTGGFMFVRKEVVDKISGLDENIFMYEEEVEWQYRIRQLGWKIGYTPTTKVIHHERKSSGEILPRGAILGEIKGLKYIYGKHFPGWKQIVLGSLLDILAFSRLVFWLLRRKPEMAKIYWEALLL